METKYNVGDVVYISDIDKLEIYTKKIHEITVDDKEILYKVQYRQYPERCCHLTFEEARAHLIKYIYAHFQGELNKVLALKDADKAN